MTDSVIVPVVEPSGVSAARRAAVAMATSASLGETDVGRVALVTTEAAANMVKHGGGGEIHLRPLDHGSAIEILAVDRGRGMSDVMACLRDGYSTAGSPGTGLGAIRRLANVVDIYSSEGTGTVLVAQVAADAGTARHAIELGAVCAAFPGESECGDGWKAVEGEGLLSILVVDGLGHGGAAHDAARTAIEAFEDLGRRFAGRPAAVVQTLHGALRSTRGAALAVVELDAATDTVRFCGIGNIRGTILRVGSERSMVSHNGTAGHQLHRVQEFSYPWTEDGVVVLHTDGVTTQWDLTRHPGVLSARHPAIIAGLIYRDFRRTRDDATVIAARRASARNGDL